MQITKFIIGSLTGLAVAAVAAFAFVTAPEAHKGATGIVKERMMGMKSIAKNMKEMAPLVRGKKPYDAAKTADLAKAIQHHAEKITSLFPKGSIHGPSEATPAIWDKWSEFERDAKDLAGLAGELADNTPKNVSSAKELFDRMSKTCLACHKSFRKKKK